MCEINWLVNYRLDALIRRDFDWLFIFENDAQLSVGCLWRLLEKNHIRVTGADEGHSFGLPAPVDAAKEVNRRIAGVKVQFADLRRGTLDLTLGFRTGHVLEVIPNSSGFEAWQLCHKMARFIAVGGGDLTVFGSVPEDK